MARHLLLRHPQAPVHLIEVAVKWPRTLWTHSPSSWCTEPAHSTATSAEVLATYRRHRQRLADALRPVPRPAPGPRWSQWSTGAGRLSDHDEAAATERSVAPLFAADVLAEATALYDAALPYHNARHALRAVAAGERLIRACSRVGVRVDRTVVRLALLFHDAGYGTDPAVVGHRDSESYSAALARQRLSGRVPAALLDEVEAAILATCLTVQPASVEAAVVRAADLADLAADFETFAANAEALRTEQEHLSGSSVPREEWRHSVDRLLSSYLNETLWPLEVLHESTGRPGFHATATANLRRYVTEAG
jgi:predicted metal-dependent HD superfamily phosphohydrolase